MAKKVKIDVTPALGVNAATAAIVDAVQPKAVAPLYNLGKLPRNGLNEGTKHGLGGTAGTYLAICAALKEGPLDMASIQAICAAQNDKGFARYAVRNHWLLPVESK
jgi:hypothetical protein